MSLKKFLDDNKIIKESTLAALMWPDKKHSAKVFSNKINEIKAGSGKQRITEADEERAKVVLKEVAKKIDEYTGAPNKRVADQKISLSQPQKITPIKNGQPKRFSLAEEMERLRNEK